MTDYVRRHEIRFTFGCVGIIIAFLTQGCQTISTYDAEAYKQQTGALAEVLKLMDKANTPYADNTKQIESTNLTVEKAYEYDRARPLNQIQVQQWNIIRDPNQGSYAGFLAYWKTKGALSPIYITEKKRQIAVGFDAMTTLEAGKIHR